MYRLFLVFASLLVLVLVLGLSAQGVNAQTTQQFTNYVQGLPSATLPLGSTDKFYVNQGGISKQAPFSAVNSGGAGTPCTLTANALQYNNAGAFGCVSGATSNGTAITKMAIALGSDNTGDIYYRNSLGNLTRLGLGASGNVLAVAGGLPAWQAPSNTDYFNVKTFGAVGDGITDDTAAIKATIAAINSAGAGVLYFPAGKFLVSSALTTITANTVIQGDGAAGIGPSFGLLNPVSSINYTDATSSVFTVTNSYAKFRDLAIQYTGIGTPSAGSAGITVTSALAGQKVDYDTIMIDGFYIDIDIATGNLWSAQNISLFNWISIGMRITNINICDAGDWSIQNSQFVTVVGVDTTALRLNCSSAGKIVNTKFNSNGQIGIAIDVEATAAATDLMIANSSFEAFDIAAIKLGNSSWPNVTITGNQFGLGTGGAPPTVIDVNVGGVAITGNVFNNFVNPPTTAMVTDHIGGTTITGNNIHNSPVPIQTGQPANFDFFTYTNGTSPIEQAVWTGTGTSGITIELLGVSSAVASGGAVLRAMNDNSHGAIVSSAGTTSTTYGAGDLQVLQGDTKLLIISDATAASGGSHPISFRAGGYGAASEVFQARAAGNLAFTNTANFSANGSVATVLGSIGPVGSHTTVQKWLTFTDGTNTFYVPAF